VKHDLWDRDPPAQPTLVTVNRDGKSLPAIAQITKSGLIFILNRETGVPLFPVEERPVPASDVPGEIAAKTQLFPLKPEPFARQKLTADLLTERTPAAHDAVEAAFAKLRSRGPFDPPSLQGTIVFPGLDGGGEWGGAAFDPETGLLYANANEMAWLMRLKARSTTTGSSGRALYLANCASCHGEDRRGNPPEVPPLVGIGDRLPGADILMTVFTGAGRMPGFHNLDLNQVTAILEYVQTGRDSAASPAGLAASGDAYQFEGYRKFLDPDGYPAVAPPWGTLSAVDVSSGRYAWSIPLGEYPELAAKGLGATGSENYGGAVVTAGGLLFIAATVYDNKFRAFDKRTGKLLWETTLPAAGCATPATYLAGGRQFVVIGVGGGKNPNGKSGGSLVAFMVAD
jgi:quinoprotein glucose dehydrogenase